MKGRLPELGRAELARRLHAIDHAGVDGRFGWRLEDYEAELASDQARLFEWACADDASARGFVLFRSLGNEHSIMHWAVAPKGCGWGRRALGDFLAWLGGAEGTQVDLEVRESNAAARRVYEALGFEVVGRRPAYYRDGETALLFRFGS